MLRSSIVVRTSRKKKKRAMHYTFIAYMSRTVKSIQINSGAVKLSKSSQFMSCYVNISSQHVVSCQMVTKCPFNLIWFDVNITLRCTHTVFETPLMWCTVRAVQYWCTVMCSLKTIFFIFFICSCHWWYQRIGGPPVVW